MSPGDEVTLRDLVETRFAHIESLFNTLQDRWDRKTDEIVSALEKLSIDTVKQDRFDSSLHKIEKLQVQVENLEDELQAQDKRLSNQEGYVKIWRWILGLMTMILVPIILELLFQVMEKLNNVL